MSNERINEALAHIRKLQNLALPKSFYNGYSGGRGSWVVAWLW